MISFAYVLLLFGLSRVKHHLLRAAVRHGAFEPSTWNTSARFRRIGAWEPGPTVKAVLRKTAEVYESNVVNTVDKNLPESRHAGAHLQDMIRRNRSSEAVGVYAVRRRPPYDYEDLARFFEDPANEDDD